MMQRRLQQVQSCFLYEHPHISLLLSFVVESKKQVIEIALVERESHSLFHAVMTLYTRTKL